MDLDVQRGIINNFYNIHIVGYEVISSIMHMNKKEGQI